ncbi:XdhC family protein [Biformimicrobium ophioploci]|uniref:XdhC/CoxI family protein n=1 Tax=Biformimicrobium ophioploci TaxID=3036711 RepID=A0ABQ6LV74_9GAMM|nr:XdhC/CoxI family protein [Microbulbifer sp. NKW57]GMG85964.1 XdhC/CoxI family protein [Microbulbifer sp. NKW57]
MQNKNKRTANHLTALLDTWYPERDTRRWILGTVYKTCGPSYRKAGSMMLCDDLGKFYGLLSGGCLESDILRHAQKVLASGQATTLRYDGADEDDISFQLGIGCGGEVHIALQLITPENNYLQLAELRAQLLQRKTCIYRQKIPVDGESLAQLTEDAPDDVGKLFNPATRRSVLSSIDGDQWLLSRIAPAPHILIMGGGIDAQPMAEQFRLQGWEVSLCDPRPANARPAYFPDCHTYRCAPEALSQQLDLDSVDAAVVMNHSLRLDAAAIRLLQQRPLHYLGLLGPLSRRDRVLSLAGLPPAAVNRLCAGILRAPIGLDLGGELPESIALSTCAEIHSILHRADAQPLNKKQTGFALEESA